MSMIGQMVFQDTNSFIMENMIMFHNHAMLMILMTIILILYIMIFMLINKFINYNLFDGQLIKIIGIIIPILLFVFFIIPSFSILYLTDENNNLVEITKILK